ncbi:MAG: hypothetical protein JO358_19730 [Alphaproteobacteria bacterium]|nr:hypothetical protein [Alphaproteobacteria bacterium]
MDSNITALEVASIGVVGVLLGSVISTAANVILAVRRERVEAQRDERNGASDLKIATRLISEELGIARAAVEDSFERKRWSPTTLRTDAWQKYKSTVASEATDQEWFELTIADVRLEILNVILPANPLGAISESTLEELPRVLRDITTAWRIARTLASRSG